MELVQMLQCLVESVGTVHTITETKAYIQKDGNLKKLKTNRKRYNMKCITCKTKITQKDPMTADELRDAQEEEDMALARRLQEEEDRNSGSPLIFFRSLARANSMNAAANASKNCNLVKPTNRPAQIERNHVLTRNYEYS